MFYMYMYVWSFYLNLQFLKERNILSAYFEFLKRFKMKIERLLLKVLKIFKCLKGILWILDSAPAWK